MCLTSNGFRRFQRACATWRHGMRRSCRPKTCPRGSRRPSPNAGQSSPGNNTGRPQPSLTVWPPGSRATQTVVDSERLRPLPTAPGPFASVYFEDSHDTQDAEAQLELRWRGLREQLEELGAEESVTAKMEHAVLDVRPPVG